MVNDEWLMVNDERLMYSLLSDNLCACPPRRRRTSAYFVCSAVKKNCVILQPQNWELEYSKI